MLNSESDLTLHYSSQINEKLNKLTEILKKSQPIEFIYQHPFVYYKEKIDVILNEIDKSIKESEIENENLVVRNENTREKILENKKRLGEEDRLNFEEFKINNSENNVFEEKDYKDQNLFNLNLEYEYLINEKERLEIKLNKLQVEINSIIDEINKIKECVGDCNIESDVKELNKNDNKVSKEYEEKLKILLNGYKKIKQEKEKQRLDFYKFITDGYKILEKENMDEIDKSIKSNFYSVSIDDLSKKYNAIEKEIEDRKTIVKNLIIEIENLENNLEGHITFETYKSDINSENLMFLEKRKDFLIKEEERFFENIFVETFNELEEICKVFEMEMVDFEKTKENLQIMKKIINELKNKKDSFLEINDLIKKRDEIKNKMIQFEINASDPKRLFRSSFQLLNEEKFRKNAVPNLLKIENSLLVKVIEYEKNFEAFFYKGEIFRENLENEMKNRIINKSVFIMNKAETPRKGK
ncbi:hypothetical protein GVAV_001049 [Gurleya vavrai]